MKSKINILIFLVFSIACIKAKAQDVYVLTPNSELVQMPRAVTAGTKSNNNALYNFSAFFGTKFTTSILIDGKSADISLPSGACYFYINLPKSIPVKSWKLVPLNKEKKGRVLPYFKNSLYTGTQSDLKSVDINVEKLTEDIYKIVPLQALKSGEYALIRMESGTPAEIYDFKIDSCLSSSIEVPQNKTVIEKITKGKFKQYDHSGVSSPSESNNVGNSDQAQSNNSVLSDVDTDIPLTKRTAENTFGIIISNEKYKNTDHVPYAYNDGDVLAIYLESVIGVPSNNIIKLKDATYNDMRGMIDKMKLISDAFDGNAKFIVYYSGHGITDEATGKAGLLPSDGEPVRFNSAFKLEDLYAELASIEAKNIMVFLDACYSGGRNGEMLHSARGVVIKTRKTVPKGNLVVFSAATDNQTATPYKEKNHGLFTYFILKKIKECKGNVTLGELSDYVIKKVKQTSVLVNNKPQLPNVLCGDESLNWRKINLLEGNGLLNSAKRIIKR